MALKIAAVEKLIVIGLYTRRECCMLFSVQRWKFWKGGQSPPFGFHYGISFISYSTVTTHVFNKKLHYREEHSASVLLSWCTLWHLSGDKQQINS